MAVDPFALTTLADVKSHLNIPVGNVSQDETLERMINSSSAKIENFLSRRILQRAYNEYQDGRSNDRILLSQWPVEFPSEVWVDSSGLFTDVSNQLDSADYVLEGDPAIGIVLLGGRLFSKGIKNIKIVYNGGYVTVPYNIAESCIMTVEYMYDMRSDRRIGVTSKSKNSENVTYIQDLPEFVINTLLPYQRFFEFDQASIAVQNG